MTVYEFNQQHPLNQAALRVLKKHGHIGVNAHRAVHLLDFALTFLKPEVEGEEEVWDSDPRKSRLEEMFMSQSHQKALVKLAERDGLTPEDVENDDPAETADYLAYLLQPSPPA